jgi:hypothetical protein
VAREVSKLQSLVFVETDLSPTVFHSKFYEYFKYYILLWQPLGVSRLSIASLTITSLSHALVDPIIVAKYLRNIILQHFLNLQKLAKCSKNWYNMLNIM